MAPGCNSKIGESFGDFSHVRRVGVLGAGVAGMQVAEQLSLAGIECVLFEKANDVGGVWRQNYADFGLQVPKELYEFPAFPYPKGRSWDKFPKGPQVQEYIEAFAEHFGLNELIRFNTSVLSLHQEDRGWLVKHAPNGREDEAACASFDFVVVATGMYGGASPHIPSAPGKEEFEGELLHSFHFREREQAHGKRVVVVGGGKSAVDCAVAAVKGGAEDVTLLFRSAHWPVPRYILNLIPFKFATYSRFGHALLPTHHAVGNLSWWLHALLTPLKWLVWRLVELIFRLQFQIPKEMLPTSRIEIDLFTGGQILTYEARDMINAGKLKIRRGAIERYTPTGVALTQGEGAGASSPSSIDCNMVVYGTGFTKTYDYLEPSVRAALQVQRDGLYLYRSVLPVGVPGLAFLGAEVSTFNNILTHGLQAAWLCGVLRGDVTLPSAGAMQRAVEREMHWKRTWMPPTSARAAIQQLHMPKYHDRLVQDMGYGACRKSNPLLEALSPYTARDYRPLFGLADDTCWIRVKTAAALLALLLLPPLLAAFVCVGVYLLPEQPPSALAKRKAADANTPEGTTGEPGVARQASPAIAAAPRLRLRSALAAARTMAGA